MREYGLPVTALRYCSIKAANEVLGMLHPAWLNYFIEMTLSKNRIPWFGAEHIEETKAIMSALLETPDAVCAVTDANGLPWRTGGHRCARCSRRHDFGAGKRNCGRRSLQHDGARRQ